MVTVIVYSLIEMLGLIKLGIYARIGSNEEQ